MVPQRGVSFSFVEDVLVVTSPLAGSGCFEVKLALANFGSAEDGLADFGSAEPASAAFGSVDPASKRVSA